MLKILYFIISVIQIVLGIFFLIYSATDIQLGFGFVLLTIGLANIFKEASKKNKS